MVKSKEFWFGFCSASGVGLVVAIVCLFYAVNEHFKYSQHGSGAYKESPNGKYEAHASNVLDYTTSKEPITYYSFQVIEKASGREIVKKRIYTESSQDMLQFRDGTGDIFWNEDSTKVNIGDGVETIWSFSIESEKEMN